MQNFAPSGFSAEQFWQRIEDRPKNNGTGSSCIISAPLGTSRLRCSALYALIIRVHT